MSSDLIDEYTEFVKNSYRYDFVISIYYIYRMVQR